MASRCHAVLCGKIKRSGGAARQVSFFPPSLPPSLIHFLVISPSLPQGHRPLRRAIRATRNRRRNMALHLTLPPLHPSLPPLPPSLPQSHRPLRRAIRTTSNRRGNMARRLPTKTPWATGGAEESVLPPALPLRQGEATAHWAGCCSIQGRGGGRGDPGGGGKRKGKEGSTHVPSLLPSLGQSL